MSNPIQTSIQVVQLFQVYIGKHPSLNIHQSNSMFNYSNSIKSSKASPDCCQRDSCTPLYSKSSLCMEDNNLAGLYTVAGSQPDFYRKLQNIKDQFRKLQNDREQDRTLLSLIRFDLLEVIEISRPNLQCP